MDGDMIVLRDVFVFDRSGIDENGKVRGVFHSTGQPPQFAERLATAGCRLNPSLFESRMEV
jgi:pilus assembly protein CpaF